MSSKKGTKRFWTAELRELAGEHLEAKAAEEAALAAAAKQLFARFSAQYAVWRNAVSCAEMQPRCSRDVAEMQPRCSRDAAEM